MNAALAMLLYKPISIAMKRAKLIKGKIDTGFNKASIITIVAGALTLTAAVVIFLIIR